MLLAAEAGQSTPGQPDRDTESIIGVELATNTLGVVDVQSVKHVNQHHNASCHLAPLNSGMHGPLTTTMVAIVGWSSNGTVLVL